MNQKKKLLLILVILIKYSYSFKEWWEESQVKNNNI